MLKKPEDTLVYVLLFPNPFDRSKEEVLSKIVSIPEAREKFLRVFKSTEDERTPLCELFHSLIPWLSEGVNDDTFEAGIYTLELLRSVISSVLHTIKHKLRLRYELLSSRDKDEIFVKVFASEDWLVRKAEKGEYKLQFRKKEEEKMGFMRVPPYAAINLELNRTDNKGLFKRYNRDDEEEEKEGSFFTYADKARLVTEKIGKHLDLNSLKNYEFMLDAFCVHQDRPLRYLKFHWARLGAICRSQPLEAIRKYYSEKIALYFAWMGTYGTFMLIAALFGIGIEVIEYFTPSYQELNNGCIIGFAIFLTFWASFFDQFWIRREKYLAWEWGTTNFAEIEVQRAEFKGKFMHDEVTGKKKVIEVDGFMSMIRKILGYSSILVMFFCVIGAAWSIIAFRHIMVQKVDFYGRIIAGVLNAVLIKTMNIIYGKLAMFLNNWENYETENLFNDNLAVKLFLFKFVNFLPSFCSRH
jgi:hypothetical protein